MTAEALRSLVSNFTSLSKEETDALRTLSSDSPYCQVVHMLMARSSKDQARPDQKERLTLAAVYSTDRAVLKWVMTEPQRPRSLRGLRETSGTEASGTSVKESPVTAPEEKPMVAPIPPPSAPTVEAAPLKKETPAKPKKKLEATSTPQIEIPPAPVAAPKQEITLEDDALRADLAKELSKLQKLKHEFEASYERLAHPGTGNTPPAPIATKKSEPPAAPSEPTEGEPLIEAIKTSKKKPKLVTPKVAEQGEIIDNFIKVAPTLPRAKPTQPAVDLSEDSVHHGDNIVSETLVNILLKQGKKDKAIEMLKKLIWKFPQKKAYFAAQIEALKG